MFENIIYISISILIAGGLTYGYLLYSGTRKYGTSYDRCQNEKQITAFAKGGCFFRLRFLSSDFNEIIHVYRQDRSIFAEIQCKPHSNERDILDSILSEFPVLEIHDEKIFSIPPEVIVEIIVRLFDELQTRQKFLRVAVL